MIHEKHGDLSPTHWLVPELPCPHLHLSVAALEKDFFRGLREHGARETVPGLIHGKGFLIGDDGPNGLDHRGIGEVVGENEGRGHDAPGPKVRTGFLRSESRVPAPPWAMLTTHLKHVGVSPAARGGEPGLCPLDGRLQVPHDASVVGSHVPTGAEVVPGAPSGIGNGATPVAVLNENGLSGLVEKLRVEAEVTLCAAPIQLN